MFQKTEDGKIKINSKKLFIIAGPCVIENKKTTFKIAEYLKNLCESLSVDLVFKASFDKANRTSIDSFRGPGLKIGLEVLQRIKDSFKLLVLSDVHEVNQIKEAAQVLDIIQIPAFLCRQTDLVLEAAKTNKIINVKKGQFVAPENMKNIIAKIESVGNKKILVTERGTCFGYNNLVVDFRSFGIMKKFGYPVIYDVTHSLQRPSSADGISGGDVEFVEPMSAAACAADVDGIFMEVHPNPQEALSDKHTSFPLDKLDNLFKKLIKIKEVAV